MSFSYETHAQAVRDRQAAFLAAADAHRLARRVPRLTLGERLHCTAARLRLPVVAPEGCGARASLSRGC